MFSLRVKFLKPKFSKNFLDIDATLLLAKHVDYRDRHDAVILVSTGDHISNLGLFDKLHLDVLSTVLD